MSLYLARRLLARLPGARPLWARLRSASSQLRPPAPVVGRLTYLEPGNQWYRPALAGPSSFLSDVSGTKAVRGALNVLARLSPDRFMEFLVRYCERGLEEFGESWAYADINTVLWGLSQRLSVESYLEIGVRQGRSMAMVAAQRPDCRLVGFDLWIADYAGMPNPGPNFVRDELQRVGHRGPVELIAGDSRATVPEYLRRYPDRFFDLVTVDGDHSAVGARADLSNVVPRIKCGGALVFDDIANPAHPELREVWEGLIVRSDRFACWAFAELGFGIAFGIKRY